MALKVGDVVALKSGGHMMTVGALGPTDGIPVGTVRVVWMGSDGFGKPEMHARLLPAVMLMEALAESAPDAPGN